MLTRLATFTGVVLKVLTPKLKRHTIPLEDQKVSRSPSLSSLSSFPLLSPSPPSLSSLPPPFYLSLPSFPLSPLPSFPLSPLPSFPLLSPP